MCKRINVQADQCHGKKFLDMIGNVLMPENCAMIVRLIQAAIDSRKEQRSELLVGSLTGYWRLRITPIYGGEELLYIVGEGEDVSAEVQRKFDQSTQLSSAETYRILVSTLRDYAIFMLDAKGCIATWNTGAMLLKQYTQERMKP
jgi:osomolarity two-component system sensor histidine kinase TcsA